MSAGTQRISVALAGDVMIGRGIDQIMRHPADPIPSTSPGPLGLAISRAGRREVGSVAESRRPCLRIGRHSTSARL